MPVTGGAWLAPIPTLSCRSQDVPAVHVQVSCGTGEIVLRAWFSSEEGRAEGLSQGVSPFPRRVTLETADCL